MMIIIIIVIIHLLYIYWHRQITSGFGDSEILFTDCRGRGRWICEEEVLPVNLTCRGGSWIFFVFPSPDVDEICFIYLPPHRVTFAPPPRFDKTLGLIRRGTEKRIESGDLDVECFHPSMRDDDVERSSITRATQKLFSKRWKECNQLECRSLFRLRKFQQLHVLYRDPFSSFRLFCGCLRSRWWFKTKKVFFFGVNV